MLLTTGGLGTDSCGTLGTVQSTVFWMCGIRACANPCLTVYIDFDAAFAWRCAHSFLLLCWSVFAFGDMLMGFVDGIVGMMQDC